MFELKFSKILLQTSTFLLQTMPKRCTSILYTVKNLVKMIFKPPSPKKFTFFIGPTPRSSKFAMETCMKFYLFLIFLWKWKTQWLITLVKKEPCLNFSSSAAKILWGFLDPWEWNPGRSLKYPLIFEMPSCCKRLFNKFADRIFSSLFDYHLIIYLNKLVPFSLYVP